jgi:hypothetical protein
VALKNSFTGSFSSIKIRDGETVLDDMLSVTIFVTFIDQNTLFLPKQHQNTSFK